MNRYNFKTVEQKWQSNWKRNNFFSAKIDKSKKKFYCLEMFPYPSGKIHMGHVRNYTIGDVLSRYKMQKGYNVLHPMGWDSFGMPAENAAKLNKLDPKEWTEKNISVMKSQLEKLGLSPETQEQSLTWLSSLRKKLNLELFNIISVQGNPAELIIGVDYKFIQILKSSELQRATIIPRQKMI